jgi:hypothetical protein
MTSYEDFQFRTQRSWRFLASCTPLCQCGICSIFSFFWIDVHEWQHLVISKHIYHRHWNTFSVVISNIFGEKTEYYCNISVGSINGTTKTLDDLGRFDLKMFRNCPIRIEIITGSHIFIFLLPRVVTVCLHFTPRYRSW